MIQNHFRFVCSNFHYVKICQIFLNFWKIPHFVFFLLLCKHWNLFQSANMNPFLCSKWKGTFKIFQKSATVNDVRILHFVEKHKQPGQLLMFLVSLAGHQWSKLGVRTETVVFVAIITDPPVFLPVFEKVEGSMLTTVNEKTCQFSFLSTASRYSCVGLISSPFQFQLITWITMIRKGWSTHMLAYRFHTPHVLFTKICLNVSNKEIHSARAISIIDLVAKSRKHPILCSH